MTEKSRLDQYGVFQLFGDIDVELATNLTEFILFHNLEDNGLEHLTLMIHSSGGDMYAGFSIVDAMNSSKLPIHVVGLGVVASAALMIFMNGEKGKRTFTPNTSIMSHQYTSGMKGKAHELISIKDHFEFLTERIEAHYVKCTGLPLAIIRRDLLGTTDKWLTAEDALKLGMCDDLKQTDM